MKNKMKRLYNWEVKERYLNTITRENSKETAYFQLLNASDMEKQLNKDLYDMDISEISLIMHDISSSTLDSAYGHLHLFNKYIEWAIEEGLTESSANWTPLDGKDLVEFGKQFVASYKTSMLTRKNLINLTKELINYADKALLLCLFEGIKGSGYSEILNLKRSDLRKEGEKYYADLKDTVKDTERTIEISEELYDLLLRTDTQETYYNWIRTGERKERYATSDFSMNVDRIFKKTVRGDHKGDYLTSSFINRKFELYKKVFENQFLRATNIINSGIAQLAYDIYKEKQRPLKKEDYLKIGERFNTPMTTTNGEVYRNTTRLKRVICTKQFEEVYGKNICS